MSNEERRLGCHYPNIRTHPDGLPFPRPTRSDTTNFPGNPGPGSTNCPGHPCPNAVAFRPDVLIRFPPKGPTCHTKCAYFSSFAAINHDLDRTMKTKVISYKSGQKTVSISSAAIVLESGEKDGIKHTWSVRVDTSSRANFTLNIDWKDLKNQGAHRLVGHLILSSVNSYLPPHRVAIDWTDTNHSVLAAIGNSLNSSFEYNLTAHYAESSPPDKMSYEKLFVASDKTDVVLVVDGKKLNVNKSFLSFHSDYFSNLFSSNSKEGQMKEIEIKEVSYEDFGLLCSSFYPNPQFPNDQTVEKLLEMASRFQVSSVVGIVEYHLLNNSRIGYERMLWFADEYQMPKLLEKCISQMNSLAMAKKLEKSPEFEKKFADQTVEKLLEMASRFQVSSVVGLSNITFSIIQESDMRECYGLLMNTKCRSFWRSVSVR
ncbi:Protein CBG24117 [Caenorhabditis briggsae]|uniref:Protein CBG24117 n=1 Tax=Caenorhabditis briggsae TaxID=6238 RepID=A8WK09_CAEBR|nr:Protein CBG24117 [Caenorhabditis briggsae]CAP20802.2 Protein CBG24117 [Caenorhabditis briggsae]